MESGLAINNTVEVLQKEADELAAIFTAIGNGCESKSKIKKITKRRLNPKSNFRIPK